MKTIEMWLEEFTARWSSHDVSGVMELFTDDVEYWETPHLKLRDKMHLESEWQGILTQQNIQLRTEVYSSSADNKHAVLWRLSYEREGAVSESAGTYLITLNDAGQCSFFHYAHVAKG